MQVSWIDPDEISKLAAQLEGPLQPDEPAPWDLDTLPDFAALVTLEEPGAVDPEHLADAIAAPVPEPLDQRGAAPAPEVEHIREKLRAIRSRAQDAGLLPREKSPDKLPGTREAALPAAERTEVVPSPLPESPPADIAPSPTPVRIAPAPHPEPAVDSSLPHSPPSAPFLPPDGSLTTRLQAFIPWAKSVAPCEDILLVDDHGDLLWGESVRADLALSIVLAAGAGLRTGSDAITHSSVFIRSRMGEEGELSVLPCPTCHGMVTLALLNAECLTNETVACLREALTLCIEGSGIAPAATGGAKAC